MARSCTTRPRPTRDLVALARQLDGIAEEVGWGSPPLLIGLTADGVDDVGPAQPFLSPGADPTGGDPVAALVGFDAPPDWEALAVVVHGRAWDLTGEITADGPDVVVAGLDDEVTAGDAVGPGVAADADAGARRRVDPAAGLDGEVAAGDADGADVDDATAFVDAGARRRVDADAGLAGADVRRRVDPAADLDGEGTPSDVDGPEVDADADAGLADAGLTDADGQLRADADAGHAGARRRVAAGRAAAVAGDPRPVRLTHVVDRQGHAASVVRRAGEEPEVGAGDGEGRLVDVCRRALGLATAPPPEDSTELWARQWLDNVMARVARGERMRGLVQAALAHPAVEVVAEHDPRLTDEAVGRLVRLGAVLGRQRRWDRLRAAAAAGAWPVDGLTPEGAAWMDDGMFARWLLAGFPTIAEYLDELVTLVPESTLEGIRDVLAQWDLA